MDTEFRGYKLSSGFGFDGLVVGSGKSCFSGSLDDYLIIFTLKQHLPHNKGDKHDK